MPMGAVGEGRWMFEHGGRWVDGGGRCAEDARLNDGRHVGGDVDGDPPLDPDRNRRSPLLRLLIKPGGQLSTQP